MPLVAPPDHDYDDDHDHDKYEYDDHDDCDDHDHHDHDCDYPAFPFIAIYTVDSQYTNNSKQSLTFIIIGNLVLQ